MGSSDYGLEFDPFRYTVGIALDRARHGGAPAPLGSRAAGAGMAARRPPARIARRVAIAYERTGQGSAIVLLHPLGADRHVWNPIVARLRDERELIAIDMPGFGESEPLRGEPTPRALADAIDELLTTLGVRQPHVAGISLGGWVALELALHGHARSATAIAPAGLWSKPLKPKPAIGHAFAGLAAPLIRPVAATGAGRRLLLSGAVAYPERVQPASRAARARLGAGARGSRLPAGRCGPASSSVSSGSRSP